jgi:hypothetical protein
MKANDRQKSTNHQPATQKPFFGADPDHAFFSPNRAASTPFFQPKAVSPSAIQAKSATSEAESISQSVVQRMPAFESEVNDPEAVQRHVLNSLPIQAKLTIGEPGDKYEQEADRVALQVVKQINAPVQSTQGQPLQRQEEKPEELQAKPEITTLQRQEEKPEELQTKSTLKNEEAIAGGEASADLTDTINSARGSGLPLDTGLQRAMGEVMGADFSGVKVHTDAQSDQLNQSIQAKAFTTGQDVFFRQGAYQPGNQRGQELIAHELTHVVQQNGRVNKNSELGRKGATSQGEEISSTQDRIIRRVVFQNLSIADQNLVKDMISTAQTRQNKTWPEGEGWKMLKWAKDAAQFRSIIENYSYKEWTAVLGVFPDASQLPAKVAQIKEKLEEKKQEIKTEAKRLYRETFSQGMTTKEALDEGLVALTHTATFRTIEDKNAKSGNQTGPFTREWRGVVDGINAGWVVHIHYDDTKTCNQTAAHVKLYVDRRKTGIDVVRWQSKLLPPLAVRDTGIDNASTDLTAHEKGLVK